MSTWICRTALFGLALIVAGQATAANPRVFISTFADPKTGIGSVQVIDSVTLDIVSSISVGVKPQGATLSPDYQFLYVVNQDDNAVTVIDTATLSVVGDPIFVGDEPYGAAISPDGKWLYVTNHDGDGVPPGTPDTVSVIDLENGVEDSVVDVGDFPIGIAVTPDGSRLFVGNGADGTVTVIDTEVSPPVVIDTLAVGPVPWWMAVEPDSSRVYVTSTASDALTVIDTQTHGTTSVPIGGRSQGIALIESPPLAFITNPTISGMVANTVTVVDRITLLTVGALITVGNQPIGAAASPEGDRVYIANAALGEKTVSVIDTATLTVIDTIPVGGQPAAFGWIVEPSLIFADGFESGDVSAW